MKKKSNVDAKAFKAVKAAIDNGDALTFDAIGLIFGPAFYQLLVVALMDAQDAARAIQGAMNRLLQKQDEEGLDNNID